MEDAIKSQKKFQESITKQSLKKHIWIRIVDMGGAYTASIFSENMTIMNIIQGSLNDCWLISAMVSIAAQKPDFLFEIFFEDSREIKKNGEYR